MYERMMCKEPPSPEETAKFLGGGAATLKQIEEFLYQNYDIIRELKYPFGKAYGWGYKYSHGSATLCYIFFETGAVTVTLQLGDKAVSAVEAALEEMLPKTRESWASRYPCGKAGGWVHYRVTDAGEIKDVCGLIKIKKAPKRV